MDKSRRNEESAQPAFGLQLYGNVVLVQSFYFCRYGKHKYLSASPEVLRIIPCLYFKILNFKDYCRRGD